MPVTRPGGFDVAAFFAALDERRTSAGLSWAALAAEVWDQSWLLNFRRGGHPIAGSTVRDLQLRGGTCQHAILVLSWMDEPPETFVVEPRPGTTGVPLPETDPEHRLRWNLGGLCTAMDDERVARGATWEQAAERLHCAPAQLAGLRTAKFATGMRLAMRITQALHRPAADFLVLADW